MSYTAKCFSCILLLIIGNIVSSQGVKEVETDPISEKPSNILDLLIKLDNEALKPNWAIGPKLYLLSPEEQKYLDYKRSTGANPNSDIYETIWPYLTGKYGNVLQTKTKKNAEVNRGMYNVLNHMDMFNAGKRAYHQ